MRFQQLKLGFLLLFFKLLDVLLLNISTTYARKNLKIKLVFFMMSVICHTKILGFRRVFQKWWNCKINGLNVLGLEVLCYFKIVVFKFSYYVVFGCQFNLMFFFWKFMWWQVLCVSRLWDIIWIQKLLFFHICQSEIFSKLSNGVFETFLHYKHFALGIWKINQTLKF